MNDATHEAWDLEAGDIENVGLIFDRSEFGLAKLRAFIASVDGERWDSLKMIADGFASSDAIPYLGIWRSASFEGGRVLVSIDDSNVLDGLLPLLWTMHQDQGGKSANYFLVAAAVKERLHERNHRLEADVAAGKKIAVKNKHVVEASGQLLGPALSGPTRALELVRGQLKFLVDGDDDGQSALMVLRRGALTESMIPLIGKMLGEAGEKNISDWLKSAAEFWVVGFSGAAGGLDALLSWSDRRSELSAVLDGVASKMGAQAGLAEVVVVADDVETMKQLRLLANAALGDATMRMESAAIAMSNVDDDGEVPWAARAVTDLENLAKARLFYTPRECKMVSALAGLVQRSPVYRLPRNAEWMAERAIARSPIDARAFKLPAPAFLMEFEYDQRNLGLVEHASRSAPRRMALVVDMRVKAMRWVMNFRDMPWLDSEMKTADSGLLVIPIDYGQMDNSDFAVKPRWSLCMFGFWFFGNEELVLQGEQTMELGWKFGVGGGTPFPVFEASVEALKLSAGNRMEIMATDTVVEAVAMIQMGCTRPDEFVEQMKGSERHGAVFVERKTCDVV